MCPYLGLALPSPPAVEYRRSAGCPVKVDPCGFGVRNMRITMVESLVVQRALIAEGGRLGSPAKAQIRISDYRLLQKI